MTGYLTYDELDEIGKDNALDNLACTEFMYETVLNEVIDKFGIENEELIFGNLASKITVDYNESDFNTLDENDYATIYGDWLASDIVRLEDDEEFTDFVEEYFGLDNTIHCKIADVALKFYLALYDACETKEDVDKLDEVWSESFQSKLNDMYHTFVEYMVDSLDDNYIGIGGEETMELGNNGYIVFDEEGNPFYAKSGKPVK